MKEIDTNESVLKHICRKDGCLTCSINNLNDEEFIGFLVRGVNQND